MIKLEIVQDTNKPRILVVGCLHGNETLGKDVFDLIAEQASDFDNLACVVANLPAYHKDKRYIDQDLNRSFPGSSTGNAEQKLAAEIMKLVTDADMVIDIHTTTSPGFDRAAITGPLNPQKQDIFSAFGLNKVVIMEPVVLATSLIGNSKNGVSIEYGLDQLRDGKLAKEIVESIKKLQAGDVSKDFKMESHTVKGTIPKDFPGELANFEYSKALDGYPFIVDEKHYENTRGFLLK